MLSHGNRSFWRDDVSAPPPGRRQQLRGEPRGAAAQGLRDLGGGFGGGYSGSFGGNAGGARSGNLGGGLRIAVGIGAHRRACVLAARTDGKPA